MLIITSSSLAGIYTSFGLSKYNILQYCIIGILEIKF